MNYSEMLFNRDKRLIDKIKELEEENKKLNELVQFNVETTSKLTKRIDKAIEYINDDLKDYQTISSGSANDLLKILKGEENDKN
jgi:hypothetical protein